MTAADLPASTSSTARPAWRVLALVAIWLSAIPLAMLIDRPVAELVHGHLLPYRRVFDALTHLIDPLPVLAGLVLAWSGVRTLRRASLSRIEIGLLRCAVAVCVGIVLKDQLKWAFGRTWPETWVQNNPSWFGNGTFGFFPFHGGQGWASFPSGHTTVVCAPASALWFLAPRARLLWGAAVVIVVVGLLGADYHWLSDIIAGTGLGTFVGASAALFSTGRSSNTLVER